MSTPPLPPYLGSWEELVKALLHNPFLGSPWPPHHALRAAMLSAGVPESGPSPDPWLPAVSLLISEISLRDIASRLPAGKSRNELVSAADEGLSKFIDDFCGTPPHPRPIVFLAAAELAAFGSSLAEGALRNQIFEVAGQLIQRTFGAPAKTAAAGASS
jgi:hypothetical protein